MVKRIGTNLDLDENGVNIVPIVGVVALSETAVPVVQSSRRINATGNTAVKASKGRLVGVTIGAAGTGTATITIYDNASAASGTVIAVIDATKVGSYVYNVDVANGIYVVSAGTTSADFTVIYS